MHQSCKPLNIKSAEILIQFAISFGPLNLRLRDKGSTEKGDYSAEIKDYKEIPTM